MQRSLASLAAGCVILAACGLRAKEVSPAARKSDRQTQSTSDSSSGQKAGFGQRIVPVLEDRIVPEEPDVDRLGVWSHYVSWSGPMASSDGSNQNFNRVLVRDLATRQTHLIATSNWPEGEVGWVGGSEEMVIWGDIASVPSDDDPFVPWTIRGRDLRSGVEHILGASHDGSDEKYTPLPEIEWPWVVWGQTPNQSATGGLDIVLYDLRINGGRKVLPRKSVGINPGIISIFGGMIYYDADSPAGRDLFRIPAKGANPAERLTTSGRVGMPFVANGAAVWQEPASGDAESLWRMPVSPRAPAVKVATSVRGQPPVSNPFPTTNFAIWLDGGGSLRAGIPNQPNKSRVLQGKDVSIPARWRAHGDRVVWAKRTTIKNTLKPTILVANLRN